MEIENYGHLPYYGGGLVRDKNWSIPPLDYTVTDSIVI